MSDAMTTAAALLARRAGLQCDGVSVGRLQRALDEGVATTGLDPDAYVAMLPHDDVAFQLFVDRVTVQETSFFRHPEQFDTIARALLAGLPDPVVIWSAACSNGQEAYSLAMLLEEAGRPGTILATDISSSALARTRAARYHARELRGLSDARRERFVRPVAGGFELSQELRNRVHVARHNLAADPPPFAPGACRLVLCRNVLIYFSREEILAYLRRLHAHLPTGGHLMIGASESLWHVSDVFELERRGGVFLYRRGAEVARPAAAPPVVTHLAARQPVASVPAPAPARAPAPVPEPLASAEQIRAAAEAAGARGDWAAAGVAYRQVIYLEPDNVLAHVGLGIALEATDQAVGALRAFRAARAALQRSSDQELERGLGGYRAQEIVGLLDSKLERAA